MPEAVLWFERKGGGYGKNKAEFCLILVSMGPRDYVLCAKSFAFSVPTGIWNENIVESKMF